ncbi:hypothetical protein BDF22DRAFT_44038 [Syncephalis plumigaleata]|nr:hypothetical protein BDF22DRAFT_44038 [Syncephalis plumigaleata]
MPDNQHGCQTIPKSLRQKLDDKSWIALVERGDCSFVDKIRAMQQSGAAAVVVGDNRWDSLITMYTSEDTSDITIPSVFILQADYHQLRYLASHLDQPFIVKLLSDDLITWPLVDVLIVTIITPTIMMVFIYLIWYIRQRQEQLADLAPRQTVNNLPTKSFVQAKCRENDPAECAICLEDFVDDDQLRIMPCRHEFHIACIDPWLTTRKRFCPICKQDICPANERTPLLSSLRGANGVRGIRFANRNFSLGGFRSRWAAVSSSVLQSANLTAEDGQSTPLASASQLATLESNSNSNSNNGNENDTEAEQDVPGEEESALLTVLVVHHHHHHHHHSDGGNESESDTSDSSDDDEHRSS